MKEYKITVVFTEPVLGSSPMNQDVYKAYIESLKPEENQEAEYKTVENREERGWTGFHHDDKGLFGYDYTWRGFLKDSADALKEQGEHGIKAYKSKIDKHLFITPRKIYFADPKGKMIKDPHGVLERPLRAMTMQGPRVTLARSDLLKAGTTMSFTLINQLPSLWTDGVIRKLFDRGQYSGYGQWRNGSYGRFEYTIEETNNGD